MSCWRHSSILPRRCIQVMPAIVFHPPVAEHVPSMFHQLVAEQLPSSVRSSSLSQNRFHPCSTSLSQNRFHPCSTWLPQNRFHPSHAFEFTLLSSTFFSPFLSLGQVQGTLSSLMHVTCMRIALAVLAFGRFIPQGVSFKGPGQLAQLILSSRSFLIISSKS